VSADLAAHTPAAPTPEAAVPAGAATPNPALELGTDSLAVPTGAAAGVAPSVRALAPVDPVEAWRDPGESMERTSLTFLAMAAALGLFVLWLRRQHHT